MKKVALLALLVTSIAWSPARANGFVPGAGAPDGGPPLEAAPPSAPAGFYHEWKGAPTDVANSYRYDDGELIVTDNVFDDTGGDTDVTDDTQAGEAYSMLEGAEAATGAIGDYTYPDAALKNNAADIAETRVALDDDYLYAIVVLNTMVDPARTGVELRLNDRRIFIHGDIAVTDGATYPAHADAVQNSYEVRLPRAYAGTGSFDLFVASGVWMTDSNSFYLPPAAVCVDLGGITCGQPGPYFDLGFTSAEPMDSYWRDRRQSALIAASTYDAATITVAIGCLDGSCYETARHGLYSRVFRSGQPIGEGVEPMTRYHQSDSFAYRLYRGAVQPYAVYEAFPHRVGPRPLVILDHFLGGNYMSYPITSAAGIAEWAEALGAIVVMPHARGEAGWYEGEAEKDVFEVWRDAAQHYNVDRERVYLVGMSMGGFSAWRLGLLYPDQFARAISWSGPLVPYAIWEGPTPVMYPQQSPPACERGAPECGYNLGDFFANARNLPYLVVHGGADELVPSPAIESAMAAFDRLHSTYRYVFYPDRRHETSYPGTTAHWVREWLGSLPTRVRNPADVTYVVDTDLDQPEFGIAHRGAYWLRDIVPVEGAQGRVEVRRQFLFGNEWNPIGMRAGVDTLGPYRLTGGDRAENGRLPSQAYVTASGVTGATLDVETMGWNLEEQLALVGSTALPLDLRLHGSFPDEVSVSGASWTRDGSDIVLHVAGDFEVVIG